MQVFCGYAVEVYQQVVPDDPQGYVINHQYFLSRDDADTYFKKQCAKCGTELPLIRLSECAITVRHGLFDYDIGDAIMEAASMDYGVDVYAL